MSGVSQRPRGGTYPEDFFIMRRRLIITIACLVAVVAILAFIKYRQIRAAIEGGNWTPPPEAVTTVVVESSDWAGSLNAVGSAEAVNGVIVSADLPGVVEEINFESGSRVKAGQVLVRLDTRQERAQLASAKAQNDLAQLSLERMQGLLKKEAVAQSELDRAEAQARSAQATVAEIQATIDRKTIRAPFAGELGIRRVNLGQYLTGGDAVAPLQALDPIFVNFAVPQQDAGLLRPGSEVRVRVDGNDLSDTGKITAVKSIIDEGTRNVEAQATFSNKTGELRPGMFVDVSVLLPTSTAVIALPASAVAYAPYGNSVYVVEDMEGPDGGTYRGVRQQFVKLGGGRGDLVAVLSGLNPGEEVVTSGVFKLRPSAAVQVNNEITPAESADPKPEDS
jgi:membrane fusion protein (multidrug efflux system)